MIQRRALLVAWVLLAASLDSPARAEPAASEWTYWVGGSLGKRRLPQETVIVGQGNGGAEVTFALATFGRTDQYGGAYELRWGPWLGTSFGPREALAETGLKLHFSQLDHAQWGTYEVRLGGGYGDVNAIAAPHFVVTLAGGVRSFLDRYDRPGKGGASGLGSVMRLFATSRVRPTSPSPWDIVFGIELTPTILGPPYSWPRIGGAEP